jgi:hypothetical protein
VAIPKPEPGLVFRYDYLWSREATAGQDYGKERPVCLAVTLIPAIGELYVVILPITHSPPDAQTAAVELPTRVKQSLGLDDQPSWVVVSEYNVDSWPNAGIAPLPDKPDRCSHGYLPPRLFTEIRNKFIEMLNAGSKAVDRRTDE